MALETGDFATGAAQAEEAVDLYRVIDDEWGDRSLGLLGNVTPDERDFEVHSGSSRSVGAAPPVRATTTVGLATYFWWAWMRFELGELGGRARTRKSSVVREHRAICAWRRLTRCPREYAPREEGRYADALP